MNQLEYDAGENQVVVVYISDDTGGPVDVQALFATMTSDAATRERDGWRIVSTAVMPMRQTGTAGNILFQSGGQYATQAALAVVYGRA